MLSQFLGTTTSVEETPCEPEKVLSLNESVSDSFNTTNTIEGAPGSGESSPIVTKCNYQEVNRNTVSNNDDCQEDGNKDFTSSYFSNLFRSFESKNNSELTKTEIPLEKLLKKVSEGFKHANVEYPGVDTDIEEVQDDLVSSKYYSDTNGQCITCNIDQFITIMTDIIVPDEILDECGVEEKGSTLIHVVMHNDEPISFHVTEKDAINAMWEWSRRELIVDLADSCRHIKVGTDPTELSIQERVRYSWFPIYREIHSFYVTGVRGYLD